MLKKILALKQRLLWGNPRENVIALIKKSGAKRIAEIGVWKGELSRMILETNPTELILVDPLHVEWNEFFDSQAGKPYACRMKSGSHTQEQLDAVAAELAKLPAVFYRMTSLEAALKVADHSLDLVYIDAVHTYVHTKDDIRAWKEKVRAGGILCGDDYRSEKFPGVQRAVNELLPGVKHRGQTWWTTV